MENPSNIGCVSNESSTNEMSLKGGNCVLTLIAHDPNSNEQGQGLAGNSKAGSTSIELSRERFARVCLLSNQELRIFLLIGKGMRPANIARYGGKQRSRKTIDTYMHRIRVKLDMVHASLLQLAMFAADFRRSGLKLVPDPKPVVKPNFRFK